MGTNSAIEWTDHTWNPTSGCTRVSPGCDHCYAENVTVRWGGDFSKIVVHPERLAYPLKRWKPGSKVFVDSMSDLFHEEIPLDFLADVFAVMALAVRRGIIFQVLTKRAHAMHRIVNEEAFRALVLVKFLARAVEMKLTVPECFEFQWPLPNVWLGVSVESQRYADLRIPLLLDTPAAIRFLSCEPLLGSVDLWSPRYPNPRGGRSGAVSHWTPSIDWVIGGGESGPAARPCHPAWARALRDACVAARVPFFWKQWGSWSHDQAGYRPEKSRKLVTVDGAVHLIHEAGIFDTLDGVVMARVPKKVAGRTLDGVEWSQFPEPVQ